MQCTRCGLTFAERVCRETTPAKRHGGVSIFKGFFFILSSRVGDELMSVVELNTVSESRLRDLRILLWARYVPCEGPAQRRARITDALGPVFAAYEGNSIETARYLARLIGGWLGITILLARKTIAVARSGLLSEMKERARSRLRVPNTPLAAGRSGRKGPSMCSFQGIEMVNWD